MLVVGLTGGIATGKSTVSSRLKEQEHISVIDLDQIAKSLLQPGSYCFKSILKEFGQDIIIPTSGELDRKKLSNIIFKDSQARRKLNAIFRYPMAWILLKQLFYHFSRGTDIVVLDAPLLIESGLYRICNIVVMVDIKEDIQLERLINRDGCSVEEAENRINSQSSRELKKRYSKRIIDNSGTVDETYEKINSLVIELRGYKRWWVYDRLWVGVFLLIGIIVVYTSVRMLI